MAALTKDRNTKMMERRGSFDLPVRAATKIYKGSIVMMVPGTAGCVPGADTATAVVMGVAEETVDNLAGATGDKRVRVATGVFHFVNNAGAIVAGDEGKNANVVDDQTVTDAATTNNIVAGKIRRIDSDGVWLKIDP